MSGQTRNALAAILDSLEADQSIPIHAAGIGPYWTALLSRRCGLASTPHMCHDAATTPPAELTDAHLIDQPALDIARWALSDDPVRAAAGMAAINSLIEPDLSHASTVNARDLLLERAPGHSVAIIGHFPFTEELRAAAGQLWVLELNPRPGDLPADQARQVIPRVDILAITGVTLINHTFDELIALCRPDTYVVMLGGSTPLAPRLFDFGVDVIGGTVVNDPTRAIDDVTRGATFREIGGKYPVLLFKDR
jgi:uncharacterized protein